MSDHEKHSDSKSQKTALSEKAVSPSHGDEAQGPLLFTAEEERRVKRKIDLVILPLLCGVYMLQYLDKQSLSYASVFGLIPDLKLEGTEYSWCFSIFYIGTLSPVNDHEPSLLLPRSACF